MRFVCLIERARYGPTLTSGPHGLAVHAWNNLRLMFIYKHTPCRTRLRCFFSHHHCFFLLSVSRSVFHSFLHPCLHSFPFPSNLPFIFPHLFDLFLYCQTIPNMLKKKRFFLKLYSAVLSLQVQNSNTQTLKRFKLVYSKINLSFFTNSSSCLLYFG